MQDDQQSREGRRYAVWAVVAIWTGVVLLVWVLLAMYWGEDCSGLSYGVCLGTAELLFLLAFPAIVIWIAGFAFIKWRAGRALDPP